MENHRCHGDIPRDRNKRQWVVCDQDDQYGSIETHRENVKRVFCEGLVQSTILSSLTNVFSLEVVQACVSLHALGFVSSNRLQKHFEQHAARFPRSRCM